MDPLLGWFLVCVVAQGQWATAGARLHGSDRNRPEMRAGSRFSPASARGLLRIQTHKAAAGGGALVGFEHFGGVAPKTRPDRGGPFSAEGPNFL